MNRKSIVWISLVFLVILSLGLGGCKRSAVPKTPIPDEGTQTVEEATKNSQTPQAGNTPIVQILPTDTPTSGGQTADTATATPQAEPPTAAAPTATTAPETTPTPAPPPQATATPAQTVPGKHVVQAGENLFRIALRYGLTTEAVARANNITNPALIHVGQVLTIPGAAPDGGSSATPTPPPAGGDVKHVVQAGENLFRIALKYNYDQYYIAKYNSISNPALIYVGQVIRIPQN
ncbi:MAG TPA: LysM domain-containing protein [Anaerolineae bacterium]|nr:LysM domain-containing protein [Anaerolineae bacterium]